MEHKITLQRLSQRRSNPAIVNRQINDIIERGLSGSRKSKWQLLTKMPDIIEPRAQGNDWVYELELEFQFTGKSAEESVIEKHWHLLKDAIYKTAPGKGNWALLGHEATGPNLVAINGSDVIAEATIERANHFDNIYGLDAQIEVMLSSLETAKITGYEKRFHVLLYGQPGCGKTQLLKSVKSMLGEEACIELDGPQTTAAGAINTIVDAEILPPFLIIEEIEKVSDAGFMWLLSALDGRAKIKKITHWGVRERACPFVVAATVNDIDLFRKRHEGALSSRFAHQLFCPRPTEQILRLILKREVESMAGNPAWIEPTIRHCMDVEGTTDPRRYISVCLTGRDKLLNGSFQANLIACMDQKS